MLRMQRDREEIPLLPRAPPLGSLRAILLEVLTANSFKRRLDCAEEVTPDMLRDPKRAAALSSRVKGD